MDRPGVRQVPEGAGKHGKMEETGCKIICGAPTTIAVKGFMMMMTMMMNSGKEQSEKSHVSNQHQRSQARVAGCIERTAVVLRQKRKRQKYFLGDSIPSRIHMALRQKDHLTRYNGSSH